MPAIVIFYDLPLEASSLYIKDSLYSYYPPVLIQVNGVVDQTKIIKYYDFIYIFSVKPKIFQV